MKAVTRVSFNLRLSVCLIVFVPTIISKTDAARINELDTEMLKDESWKPGAILRIFIWVG